MVRQLRRPAHLPRGRPDTEPRARHAGGAGIRFADCASLPGAPRWWPCASATHGTARSSTRSWRSRPTATRTGSRRGHDFFSVPRLSPDGTRLAWLSWDHPNMPWDGTELWVADARGRRRARAPRGSWPAARSESIFQPRWSPDGVAALRLRPHRLVEPLRRAATPSRALRDATPSSGSPMGLRQSTYVFLADGRIVAPSRAGRAAGPAAVLDDRRAARDLELPYTAFSGIRRCRRRRSRGRVAASHATETAVGRARPRARGDVEVLASAAIEPSTRATSRCREPIEFPTEGGLTAHAFYYPPANQDFAAPGGRAAAAASSSSHGGPTGHRHRRSTSSIQFWTSRGFAVVDVNYGGSTGYGRAYRERLQRPVGHRRRRRLRQRRALPGRARARWTASALAIRGGSAGGYTTLGALAFRDVFAAGASYFGVADLRRWRATRTSSSRATSTASSAPTRRRRDSTRERSPRQCRLEGPGRGRAPARRGGCRNQRRVRRLPQRSARYRRGAGARHLGACRAAGAPVGHQVRRATLGGMKTYHLTTFGCQMNEHDSERMKGMLESLGYARRGARRRRPDPLQHLLDP